MNNRRRVTLFKMAITLTSFFIVNRKATDMISKSIVAVPCLVLSTDNTVDLLIHANLVSFNFFVRLNGTWVMNMDTFIIKGLITSF
jgi:hypothetical protein